MAKDNTKVTKISLKHLKIASGFTTTKNVVRK
jgi:hypothetical protein